MLHRAYSKLLVVTVYEVLEKPLPYICFEIERGGPGFHSSNSSSGCLISIYPRRHNNGTTSISYSPYMQAAIALLVITFDSDQI